MRTTRLLTLLAPLLLVSACDYLPQPHHDEKPAVGSLTQNLTMIDSTGKIYGSVQLDPINGGKVFDAEGRLIGKVVTPPAPSGYAPAVQ